MGRRIYQPRPNKCLEKNPTNRSTIFCNEYVSFTAIALMTGMTVASISYIFSGKRKPSVETAKKMSKALGMELGAFIWGLETHISLHNKYEEMAQASNQQ